MEILLNRALGRFLLSNICNLDETPLPLNISMAGNTDRSVQGRFGLRRLAAVGINDRLV